MSVRQRLEDGLFLWSKGRKQSAFTLILIAVAATARKRYPRSTIQGDGEAFRKFCLDEMGAITDGPSKNVAIAYEGDERVPLEKILYDHLRCELVHKGAMPETIEFSPPRLRDGRIYHVLRLRSPLGFPEGWVHNLAKVVATAPENADEFR